MMRIFCSWCGLDMGEKPGLAGTTVTGPIFVTHGLCDGCAHTLNAQLDARYSAVLAVERTIEETARARRAS